LHQWMLRINFEGVPPLTLRGPWAPWLAVVISASTTGRPWPPGVVFPQPNIQPWPHPPPDAPPGRPATQAAPPQPDALRPALPPGSGTSPGATSLGSQS